MCDKLLFAISLCAYTSLFAKNKVKKCEFKDLDDQLRDRLVCSIGDQEIQKLMPVVRKQAGFC